MSRILQTGRITFFCLIAILAFSLPAVAAPKRAAGKSAVPTAPSADASPRSPQAKAELAALLKVWKEADYQFTHEVQVGYLKYAGAQAMAELAAEHKTLPDDFLNWVNHDPVVATTVYGARLDAAKVLLLLRSLEIDLGETAVRKKYTQLALAMAVVHAKDEPPADISPRPPLALKISACPLKPVNTKDPNRKLDVNDHIINFLNDHAPVAEQLPEGAKIKGLREVYSTEKKKHPLVAADVLASKALQDEFNHYMKSKGQTVRIDIGDHVIYPDMHEGIHDKAKQQAIRAAFKLFRDAYEAKGLLPAERDPAPTPAEKCAFLIRNYESPAPATAEHAAVKHTSGKQPSGKQAAAKNQWPKFPLNAPWPVLTFLAADNQSLRETDDIWKRYCKGEVHTYGEYIGGIAQQFDFQSARRLCPYPFSYGTYQMMLKDGGVCGTMANIAVRTYESLGVPACTAGQPGHCALIAFRVDDSSKTVAKTASRFQPATYILKGEQYVTGGDDKTSPHAKWYFGDIDDKRDMAHHQSIAWAVNFGLKPYVDSTLAYDLYRVLPEDQRAAHGLTLIESALAVNPYNMLLLDAGQSIASTPEEQMQLWEKFHAALATVKNKPGCPTECLYCQTVENNMFKHLAKLPAPSDKKAAAKILAFLEKAQGNKAEALVRYCMAVDGLPTLLSRTKDDLQANVKGQRTAESCEVLAEEIKAAAREVKDPEQNRKWLESLSQIMAGHEEFPKSSKAKAKMLHDPCAETISKLLAGIDGNKKKV